MIPIGEEKLFTGSLKWTGSRTDTHTLKIVLQPPERLVGCPVPLSYGKCPLPVYQVQVPAEPQSQRPDTRYLRVEPKAAGRVAPAQPRGGITPLEEDRLNAAKGRNVLESIDDQLRRQGLGN
jgi:hypothetical protein